MAQIIPTQPTQTLHRPCNSILGCGGIQHEQAAGFESIGRNHEWPLVERGSSFAELHGFWYSVAVVWPMGAS